MNHHNRDVLADILNDPQPASRARPESADLIRLIYRNRAVESEDAIKHSHDPISKKRISKDTRKKKATYYLPEKVLVELCEAKARIKVLVPSELKAKVSMSRIVDYSVSAILEEFSLLGHRSDLMQAFLTDRKKRDKK